MNVGAIIRFQWVGLVVLTAICWALVGFQAAISLALGGVSYAVPSTLSALVLKLSSKQAQYAPLGFVISEGLKVILALILMTAIFVFYKEIRFIPYLLGLLFASHFVFLFFLRVHRYGKQ
ncbi:ATP synthase subunit I [Kingella negevensis]|uniref:ATP synthase I chain n=1 Tax=Kingella negevensis TaxID=1522312 RepID=A0A238HIB6_9NEIS|nr:ATP synthase subunit I [Kingella negevensis]MDK4684155.1 ATP synthase subunit I [Kingella negevensis]MDK4696827.1 ATP synthase subunit I [Kingella negevensis]MDK4708012.1 ATP synthase subunit I [Kingella negevensis]MDK4709572.1 ATP synthase subunit I [Kingella negevensis]SNB73595.1 ATP synthase I chain [Kingella negevensis]